MYERVTQNLMNNNLLEALNNVEQAQNQAMTEVDTQQSVNEPSDNPGASAQFSVNQALTSSNTQYLQNITTLNGGLQVADSALSSANGILTQAVTLGVEGANGGLSAAQQQDVAAQISQLQQQMVQVANTTFQGQYIFAGTATGPAFVANSGSSSGVTYQGNASSNKVDIAAGVGVSTGVPGSQIFLNASGNVFQSLNDLQSALQSGNTAAAQSAVTEVQNALTQLGQQRTIYGTTMDQLNSTQTYLNNENDSLSTDQNTLVGADLAKSITALQNSQTAEQAILDAGARVSAMNLFNVSAGQNG